MIDIHQALKKAKKLDFSDWKRLVLLAFGAFLLGLSTTFLEVGTVSLFLQKNTFHAIGFDFLMVALCLVLAAPLSLKLERCHGYGGVPLTAFLTILLFIFIKGIEVFPESIFPINILFIYKYLMPALVAVSFWSITSRFIALKFNSLKYTGVLAACFLGFSFGGKILIKNAWNSYSALEGAVWGFIALTIVIKILVWLLPQPSETFVRKSGGVQDSSEQKMIDCILMLAFTYTSAHVLGNYLFYQYLIPKNSFLILAKVWMFCGGLGLLSLIILSQTRFLYITLLGIYGLTFGFLLMAAGTLLELPGLLYSGVILSWICSFLYWRPYIDLLPHPLTFGEGIHLQKKCQMLIEPLGFIFVGATVLTVSKEWLSPLLLVLTFSLGMLLWLSVILYNHLLLRLCKMRWWCGAPLMLASGKLINHVIKGASSNSFYDVVYFLKTMEVAHFFGLKKQLLKALYHPLPEVRLFALDRLDANNFYKVKVQKIVQKIFKNDKNPLVRARALAFLIRAEGEYDASIVDRKYSRYLDNKELKPGAIMGFLQSGGEWALMAMDGLQQMVQSTRKEDNLKALMIIEKVPQKGLVRLLLPLLQSSDPDIVRRALLVAGHIGHVQTLSFVFQALDKPEFQEEALQALSLYGSKVFPPLEKMLQNPNVPFTRRKSLILFLGLLQNGEGKQILLRNLYIQDIKMRKEIFRAILDSKITWTAMKRKKILRQGINQDVIWWNQLNQHIQACQSAPLPVLGDSFAFIRHSLEEMRQDLRELILDQLILFKPNALVKKAVKIIRGKPSQKFISACGILQDLLPTKLYKSVHPILLAPVIETEQEKISMDAEQAKHFLGQLIQAPDIPINHWIIASALLGIQKIGKDDFEAILDKAFSFQSSIVLEAALDLLTHSKWDKKAQEDYLKEQINKVPKNLILEDYIKHRRKNDHL